jgi:hypothetical protein
VGWVTAAPDATTATRAIRTGVEDTYAIATQQAACAVVTVTIRTRLSSRSASRPASGASNTSGPVAAISSAATAYPPAPRPWSASSRAVAERRSPAIETPRAAAAIRTSRQRETGSDVKDIFRS